MEVDGDKKTTYQKKVFEQLKSHQKSGEVTAKSAHAFSKANREMATNGISLSFINGTFSLKL